MGNDDETWFDALAGHDAPASAADAKMQSAIRAAAAKLDEAEPDVLAERRLLARLEREGLLQKPQRWRAPRLAQAAVIVLCVGLVVELVRVDPAGDARYDAEGLSVDEVMVAEDTTSALSEEQASAKAVQPQARAALQPAPLKSSAARELAPPNADQQVAGEAPSAERRESFAAAPMPDIVVRVDDPATAWRHLLSWVEQQQGLVVLSHEESARRIRLSCNDAAACEGLQAWLREQEASIQALQIGQVIDVRLEPRR